MALRTSGVYEGTFSEALWPDISARIWRLIRFLEKIDAEVPRIRKENRIGGVLLGYNDNSSTGIAAMMCWWWNFAGYLSKTPNNSVHLCYDMKIGGRAPELSEHGWCNPSEFSKFSICFLTFHIPQIPTCLKSSLQFSLLDRTEIHWFFRNAGRFSMV